MTAPRDLGPCRHCWKRPAVERHHPTACCAGDDVYLDPEVTVALCARCHDREHASWRTPLVALDCIDDPLTARRRRLAWTEGWLLDGARPPVTLGASVLSGLAIVHFRVAEGYEACAAELGR